MMKLMTDKLRASLPRLYMTENERDPLVRVKYFTPWAGWSWYGIEFDGDDLFFGWVVGIDAKLGYFSLRELEEYRGPRGLCVERDLYFEPTPISELRQSSTRMQGP